MSLVTYCGPRVSPERIMWPYCGLQLASPDLNGPHLTVNTQCFHYQNDPVLLYTEFSVVFVFYERSAKLD